jgi:hypothetical protein
MTCLMTCLIGILFKNHLQPTKQDIKTDTVENSHLQKNFQGRKKNILKDTVKVGPRDIQDSTEPQINLKEGGSDGTLD